MIKSILTIMLFMLSAIGTMAQYNRVMAVNPQS